MEFTARTSYPAPASEVFAMLVDEAFLGRCCLASGAHRHHVSTTDRSATVSVEVDAPAEARPLVGPRMTIEQRFFWDEADASGARRGHMRIAILGAPVSLDGTCELRPVGARTSVDYAGQLVAKVPLLGRRVEQLAAPSFGTGFRLTEQLGRDWLAERRRG